VKVVAVVLNWKRPDDTIGCVASLRETSPDTDVLVVDNASGDGSVEKIAAAHPGVDVLQNPENLGYAGGNNAGIARALEGGADAVLVLNNDLVLRGGCVDELVRALSTGPRASMVAPVSLLRDDPGVVDFWRARVDLPNMALNAEGRDERRIPYEDSESDYVTGSAFLARREMFETVGMFDERFFLVWEDVDLSLRTTKASGHKPLVISRAQVLHGRSVSFGGENSPLYNYFYARNSYLVARKHLGALAGKRARRMLDRRYAGWAGQAEPGSALQRAIARGREDGRAGRFGPPPADLAP
jgi:GT2 family glycosyltransferase